MRINRRYGMADTNRGAGADGSRGATYNDQGDLTGPDSPAGDAAGREAPEEGQGDDLVDRLGGGEGKGAGLSGAGTQTGDLDAAGSEATARRPAAAGIGDDPGAPGGMGGVGAAGGTGAGRPPGGLSPVGAEDRQEDDDAR
jgi:hypothetical protein